MRINLREEETLIYANVFSEYMEKIQDLNKKVNDVLNEVMEESKYDKLQKLVSNIIDTYTETIVNNIEGRVFGSWIKSEASLRSCLRTYKAGDAADAVCKQIEASMNDIMMETLKIEKGELMPTERPVVSEEGLEKLIEICKSAGIQADGIKDEQMAQIRMLEDENDIYGTLKPLVEGVATNIKAFFEASLEQFIELQQFVNEVAIRMQNIAEEKGVIVDNVISVDIRDKLNSAASLMGDKELSKSLDPFKQMTKFLYNKLNEDISNKERSLSYNAIAKIMEIYRKFYSDYGDILIDRFKSDEERSEFVKREYIQVTRDRNNDKFFEEEEFWTFISHAEHTYIVFDRVAEMMKNIALACKEGKANDINLLYAGYVLFTPIMEGCIDKEDGETYRKFSKWASEEIKTIIGAKDQDDGSQEETNDEITFEGANFSDENKKIFIIVVEKIVNQVGEDKLNKLVDKHYDTLSNSRKKYSKKVKRETVKKHSIDKKIYGRYTVNSASIQMMEPVCEQVNSILEPLDKFYKEKFKNYDKGYDRVNEIIHAISSFIGLWGVGTLDLSKIFSAEDSDKAILEKIQIGGLALASCSSAGIIINGGAQMLKIIDWAMPLMKKSKMLVKLSEKVWNLTRQDIQIPYVQRMMDQYMMEHYELKFGMWKEQGFTYYHKVALQLKDEYQRRSFENAVFAAETCCTPQHYIMNEPDTKKRKEKTLGIFLNLVRSGLCSKQNIKSEVANAIVDKLYIIYVENESIRPRVDINPSIKNIGEDI